MCGSAYDSSGINERCKQSFGGQRCPGSIKSELRPNTWSQCPECQASGANNGVACAPCKGSGWLFASTTTH
ncbi:MAG: hypothetical protein K8S98_01735 [Planctomycetes bacterium]|nr:hypothetical protein [Planctomycetota bacterium]